MKSHDFNELEKEIADYKGFLCITIQKADFTCKKCGFIDKFVHFSCVLYNIYNLFPKKQFDTMERSGFCGLFSAFGFHNYNIYNLFGKNNPKSLERSGFAVVFLNFNFVIILINVYNREKGWLVIHKRNFEEFLKW